MIVVLLLLLYKNYFLTSIDLCLNDLLLFSAFWSLFSIWDFNSFLYWKSRANNSFIAESTANLRASSCFLHCRNCSVRRLTIIKIIIKNLHRRFVSYYILSNDGEDFVKFCGLLRKHEL